jgi:hypothetical protein
MKRVLSVGLLTVAGIVVACSDTGTSGQGGPVIIKGAPEGAYPAGMVAQTIVRINDDRTRKVTTKLITIAEQKAEEALAAENELKPPQDREAYSISAESCTSSGVIKLFDYAVGDETSKVCPNELCFIANSSAPASVDLGDYRHSVAVYDFPSGNFSFCDPGFSTWSGVVRSYDSGSQAGCFNSSSSGGDATGTFFDFVANGAATNTGSNSSITDYLFLNQYCTCSTGEIKCGSPGVCTNISTNSDNCGSCGNACTGGKTCQGGECACAAGYVLCAGTCVDANDNCGSCGHACTGGDTCQGGECACEPGYTHCSGVCVNEQIDPNNCGACGNVVPSCGGGEGCYTEGSDCSLGTYPCCSQSCIQGIGTTAFCCCAADDTGCRMNCK